MSDKPIQSKPLSTELPLTKEDQHEIDRETAEIENMVENQIDDYFENLAHETNSNSDSDYQPPPSTPGSSSDSDKENWDNNMEFNFNLTRSIDYNVIDGIVDYFKQNLSELIKSCFNDLVQDLTTYQFSAVYEETLSIFYTSGELLSMDREQLTRHIMAQEELTLIKNSKFVSFVEMHYSLLKNYLEHELTFYVRFRRRHNLTLGNVLNTNIVINRIKNFLRNARHLHYSAETHESKLREFFDLVNAMENDNQIHFRKRRYRSEIFDDYPQFINYKLIL